MRNFTTGIIAAIYIAGFAKAFSLFYALAQMDGVVTWFEVAMAIFAAFSWPAWFPFLVLVFQ